MRETGQGESDSRRSIPKQAEMTGPPSRRLSWGMGAADWACVAAVAAFTLAVFWRGLLDPVDIIRTDAAHQFQPFYTFTIHEVAAGRFPHWTPYVSNGVPFHATTHGAVLYPLGWPLFVFGYPIGYLLCITLHFFLTAVVMLLFLRMTLRCGPLPSLIGAVSFAFGGFTLGHVPHLNYVPSYPWFILTIFLLSQAIGRSSWAWAVAGAIPVGLMSLAGAVHLLLILGVGLAIWATGETGVRVYRKAVQGRGTFLSMFWPIAAIALALVLGGVIGMAQLCPAWVQSDLSTRAGVGWDFITERCAHPVRSLLRMVAPFYYGSHRIGYWGEPNLQDQYFYVGMVPLFASIMALWFGRSNPWVPRLLVLILAAAVVAAGRFLPVYRLLFDYVPLFDRLRNPVRIYVWVQFGVSCLGAIGLHAAWQRRAEPSPRSAPIVAVVTGVVLLAVLAGSLIRIHTMLRDPSAGLAFVESLEHINDTDRRETMEAVKEMPQRLFAQPDLVTWLGIISSMLSALGCTALFAVRRLRTRPALVALLALLGIDLWTFSAGMVHNSAPDPRAVSVATTDIPDHVRFLQDRLGAQRYICWGWDHANLDRFRGMQFGIRNAVTSDLGTFHARRQWELMLLAWRGNRRVLNLLGVRYWVLNRVGRASNAEPVYQKKPVCIVENREAFPPAFLARSIRVYDDPNAIVRELAAGRADLSDVALLEDPVDPLPRAEHREPGTLSHVRDLPGHYWMTVDAPGLRQLVLTETFHPQWKCTIDGKETPIYRTDYTFMSVRVPAGSHELHWWFEPTYFKYGLVATTAGSLSVLVLLGAAWLRRRRLAIPSS